MAALVALLISLDLLFSHINVCLASTHWVVTEDGKIESQMDSVFNMKRPYDLVAFLKQEERASMLEKLKKELLSRKDEIDRTEDGDTGLEEKFYKTDPDCLAAGKHLPDLDLYISTVLPLENKGIRPEDHLPEYHPGSFLMQPDCTLYTDLPYSPYTFEHLEGMKDRHKLPGTPELGLKNAITYQDNEDEYGHRINEAIQNNKTSWVLYNMAAFYWRIKGDPFNVIECVRRALHYSPRIHKDVALISLANVLHRARYSNEAAIVVHAALDISRELNVNHFTLGNIYAVLGEYNKSVICFENTLKIQPDFEAAAKRKHAVLCHAKLESALEAQHRSLQRTLNDLKDYQKKHDFWQQQNDKLQAEQVPVEVKLAQHVSYEEIKIRELSTEIGEYCKMGDKDGKQVLMCSWGQKNDPALSLDLVSINNKGGGASNTAILEKIDKVKSDVKSMDYSKPLRGQKFTYETVKVPRFHGSQVYLNDDWPSKEECDTHVQKVPDSDNLTSTYMSPENKGYEVKALLTEALGLKDGDEHPLPWYPPVCVTLLDIPEGNTKSHDDIHSISYEQRTKIPLKLYDRFQTEVLLKHVNNGKVTIEEIGQRILAGLKQNVGPKWILFNLAGLYWRIIGNNYHGIECFRRSVYTAPDDVQDVPEVNLANILYRWGRYDDAKELIRESMKLNQYEPATNFLYGNILWAQKNYTGAIWRYQLALEADPHDKDVLNTLRALKCFLKYHQAAQSAAPVEHEAKVLSNCVPRLTAPNDMMQSESRVICRNEGGEEKCIIETRTRNKGDCGESCTQTCSMGPSDTCQGTPGVEGPEGRKHGTCGQCCCNHCQGCSQRCSVPSGHTNSCQQPKANKDPLTGARTEEIMFSKDFVGNLDEVTEHLERTGFCDGEECSQIKIQQNGKQPHIKLEHIKGVLHQKLIFSQSQNEVTVEPDECVIFNDGTKTSGCYRPEYKDYVSEFERINQNPDSLTILINGHLAKILPIHMKGDKSPKIIKKTKELIDLVDRVPTFQGHADFPVGDELYVAQTKILQLREDKLPDTRKYVGTRMFISIPRPAECQKLKKINIQKFSSTWLSFSAKKISIHEHINFKSTVVKGQYEKPYCEFEVPEETIIDTLPGVEYRGSLKYEAENGLREVLQKLGGTYESIDVAGTRIAQALQKNDTSWVLANVAALYWRVQGDASRALDCLRTALYFSPSKTKDIALLSTANILHRAGYLNDAIAATSYAMDISKGLVVSHFNMANLYAAKGQWDKAAMFYESTLGLQSTFEPAKQRLQVILCLRTLQKQEKKSS